MESKNGLYIFDSDNFEFRKLKFQTDIPECKYHAAITFVENQKMIIIYGGYSYLRNE